MVFNIPGDVEHKHEVITEDEEAEDEINVDDDDPYDKAFHAKTNSLSKFSFSISNILSDTFGPKPVKIEANQSNSIFRPFEIRNFISSQPKAQNSSSIFLSNFRLSEFFDYSTKQQATPQTKSDNSSLMNSLYNSLASYPKIQEEIVNSHKKNPHHVQQPPSNYHSTTSKIPPLGGLCKTISQIGQENASHSSVLLPRAPSLGVQSKSNSLESINKIQQSTTDSVGCDSDDCTSEASVNKDESQKMWPAWVSRFSLVHFKLTYYVLSLSLSLLSAAQIFCTRYSDRPSSGEFYFMPTY